MLTLAQEPENVPLVVMHYSAPVVVLLYFIFVSRLYVTELRVDLSTTATESFRLKSLKWIFLTAILTFVRTFRV